MECHKYLITDQTHLKTNNLTILNILSLYFCISFATDAMKSLNSRIFAIIITQCLNVSHCL